MKPPVSGATNTRQMVCEITPINVAGCVSLVTIARYASFLSFYLCSSVLM